MNTFNDSEVLKKALVGVEFEFYSNKSIEDTAKEISILLGKKIRVEAKAHSDFEVTADEFKIEPDMSGGEKLMELVTGAVPYYSGRMMIIKVCKWIEENGYTNDRSSIHLNISFDKNLIENKYRISKMNVLKFILDFKEAQVFKFFPERKDSAYAKSIKFVLPKSDNFFFDGLNITPLAFTFPDSKYYGVNFEKRHNNYLEFRYIGGKDWEKKTTKILHLLDMFLLQLWKSTENTSFDPLHAIELRKILASNERIINARSSWKSIEKGWSGKVKLTVDLKDTPQIIDMHWSNIKERVLRLFSHGELESGHINYDSDNGMIQVEGGRLPYCVDLRGYEFVRCYVRGEFTECDFFGCDIHGSDIHSCNFYQSTQLNSSKLESSYVHQSCKLDDCYIYGNGLMKGSMTGGIFRMGKYDKKTAKFDGTEKILYTEV
jgi:hypothetical protein|tara:strand:+ start:2403 stop:3698 length:1296 start_codon:yes stop_codon:yes gene_type:complete